MMLAFVASVLLSYLGWTVGTTPVLALVATFFVMPLIAWFVFSGYQIFCSVCRFSLRDQTRAT